VNLDKLKATFEANKTVFAGAGAVAVAGFALYKRSHPGASPEVDAGPGPSYSAGAQSGQLTGAAYDSSGSDVYNALQPQIEQLGTKIDDLSSTIPVPAPPASTAPAYKPGYYGVTGASRTYYLDDQGNLDWISKAEGQAIKKSNGGKVPKINLISKDSTFWKNRTYLDPKGTAPKTPDKVWPYPIGG